MVRSRFFWRLYVTYMLLVVVTAAAIGLLIHRLVQRQLEDEVEGGLWGQAAALVPLGQEAFASIDLATIRQSVETVGADSGTRVTLIAPDGTVIADSSESYASMDNHGDRPEVIAAISAGRGSARRFSTTAQIDTLYVARRVGSAQAPAGLVRVAIPLADLDVRLVELRTTVLSGAAVGILLALVLGTIVTRRFTAPVTEMSEVSEALRRGEYTRRVAVTGFDEIGTLGGNLNRLADELTERLAGLSRQTSQLNAFIGAMQEAVVAVDVDGTILLSNRVARRLFGTAPDESTDERLNLDQAPAIAELFAAHRAHGAARRELAMHVDGHDVVLDVRVAPFTADDDPGYIIVMYDITNLRRLERVRTDFVANVSHELKTPLTSIQGYVETLLDGAVHDEANNVRFLERIAVQVRRLSSLVADLLSLAKIESSDVRLGESVVDWRDPVTDSVAQRRDPFDAKGIQLEVDMPDSPICVRGDVEAMRQIVDNLLDNAISYTPCGGRITIGLQEREGWGVLVVRDSGIGIPQDDLERIFERFYRVDRGRSRQLGGTGLGLSIVRNLAQRMGGAVEVDSVVNQGSEFRVALVKS